MRLFVGSYVSLAKTAICVVSEHGKIVKEAEVASEPEPLLAWLRALEGDIAALGLDAGPLSQWLHRGLIDAGMDAMLMETRQVKGASAPPPASAGRVACDFGERINDRFGLVKRGDRGTVFRGVSLLREVLAGFDTHQDTPPSRTPSLKVGHSSGPTRYLPDRRLSRSRRDVVPMMPRSRPSLTSIKHAYEMDTSELHRTSIMSAAER